MGNNIIGLSEKAKSYLEKNSVFIKGASIGCKKSDGTINIRARMFEKELVNDEIVFMFEYSLKNGTARTKVQQVVGSYIFISLVTPQGKEIKWSKKGINKYIAELEQNP